VHAQLLISANLLHHAVELLIKANLSRNDSAETIRQYGYKSTGYGHSLDAAWQEFKKRNSDPANGLQPGLTTTLAYAPLYTEQYRTVRGPIVESAASLPEPIGRSVTNECHTQ
jgi:hypothetical protein